MTKINSTSGFCLALLVACTSAAAESRYPAADFQPVIITQDAELIAKHNAAAKERANAVKAQTANASSTAQPEPPATVSNTNNGSNNKEDSPMENFPIALIIIALAGFVFWSSKRSAARMAPSGGGSAAAPVAIAAPAGDTGVSRYVAALEEAARKAAGTGVSRYVKNLEAAAKSKAAAAPPPAKETGVQRYLNNRE